MMMLQRSANAMTTRARTEGLVSTTEAAFTNADAHMDFLDSIVK